MASIPGLHKGLKIPALARQAGNRFLGFLIDLQIRAQKGLRMKKLYVLTFEDLVIFGFSQVLIICAVIQLREKFNLLKGKSREQFVVIHSRLET